MSRNYANEASLNGYRQFKGNIVAGMSYSSKKGGKVTNVYLIYDK